MLTFDENIIINIIDQKKIRLFHPFYKINLISNINVLKLLLFIKKPKKKIEILKNFKDTKFELKDSTFFSVWDNLYNNPDFYSEKNIKLKIFNILDILNYLKNISFIIYSRNKNKKYNLEQKDFFDLNRGNINQRILKESFNRKEDLSTWWVNQKFDKRNNLKKTPYKYIQEFFLKKYFLNNLKNKTVLEIGSGNGYYTKEMSKYAKKSIGIDYDVNYINISNLKKNNDISFYQMDIFNMTVNNKFRMKFDYIFMIDVFLFLFDKKFQKNLFKNKITIMKNIKKFLKKNGKLLICDPHIFWLVPQLGSKSNPYGIITEYRNKYFSSIETISNISNLFYEAGFLIERIYEPEISLNYKKINQRTFNFYNQFPQWIVYEIVQR